MAENINSEKVRLAFESMRRRMVDDTILRCDRIYERAKKMTPIEQIVFYALMVAENNFHGIKVSAQVQIKNYRADFVVEILSNKFVIECDGHDFHEKTKEQAQHDKQRDREIQHLGYKVYRFTGSEIWRSDGDCVLVSLGFI